MLDKHNIILIGPEGAGKTQIFNRLTGSKKKFETAHKARPGFIPASMKYAEKNLQIEYSDCGPDIESEQINAALLKASKICLVFDVTDSNWKKTLDDYLLSKGINLPSGVQLLLLGNKIDRLSMEQLIAVRSAAESYAILKGAKFVEYSAKENTHLGVLIDSLTTGLPVTLSSSAIPTRRASFSQIPTRRASFSQKSGISSSSNRPQLLDRVLAGNASLNDLGESSDEEVTPNKRAVGGGPQYQQTPPRKNSTTNTYSPFRNHRSASTPEDTNFSFALRLAGMALIVTAITSLIYLAIVTAGFVSSVVLTGAVNQVVVTVGGLLGMSAPVAALTQFFATYGISAVAGSELLAAGASLVTLGVGFGLRRLGQKPAAANEDLDQRVVAPRSTLSTALRYVGMALMAAALVNAIYLLLIATNVFSAVALTAGMNHLLVTVGGLLGFAAPVTAFGNACAAIGLSTTAATGALSATGSLLMAGIGYSMFRRNAPVRSLPPRDELTLSDRENDGRTTPPLRERKYS